MSDSKVSTLSSSRSPTGHSLQGKSAMTSHLADLKAALADGLGDRSADFDMLDGADILERLDTAVAMNIRAHRGYLVAYSDTVPDEQASRAVYLAKACAEMTRKWKTLVAPTMSVRGVEVWGSPSQRAVLAFPLVLLDKPDYL